MESIRRVVYFLICAAYLSVSSCALNPLARNMTPTPPNTLTYDAPVTLSIKAGASLPGTSIAYAGKTDTGAAKVTINNLVAPKQVGDSLDWQGVPATDVKVNLTTRVATYDDQAITVAGTVHLEIGNVSVKPGGAAGATLIEFAVPVLSYSLSKSENIPGTNISFVSSTADGAQFAGLEGYPYRKQFDSIQYLGRLNPKVFLRLDLRVVSFSDKGAIVGGSANIKIEN